MLFHDEVISAQLIYMYLPCSDGTGVDERCELDRDQHCYIYYPFTCISPAEIHTCIASTFSYAAYSLAGTARRCVVSATLNYYMWPVK